ncbi:Protein IN CHLOROPLAST ATPASE BIOGENESIS chloroplastic [Euphorbia peplus]|nr:Protein IN CHLOROPLAST ATPASE BIOGENESIS chloroplastic [Euphorbia peplus]
MKIRLYGAPRATSLFLKRRPPSLRAYSSFPEHSNFITEVAAIQPPKHLPHLLRLLKTRGESIVSPGVKRGLIPLVVPLAKNSSGAIIGLLRWPTAPAGMEMPVVEVHKHGVSLLAKTVDQFIHRILVDEDAKVTSSGKEELFSAVAGAWENLYAKGDFAKSMSSDLDMYLIKKVGLFPDVLERRAMQHFEKGDHVSALITAEFYAKKGHFPGFGRPFVFNAEVLLKVGPKLQAKDAARGALKSPWWTLGCRYQEVARIAEWEDEPVEYIKGKMTDTRRQEDLSNGKDPAQIALDEAAFLLDLASVEGTWDESVDQIAACYKEAGLVDVAKFLLHRE